MSGHWLNEAETHLCDLPFTGRRTDREFPVARCPVGRRWQCDECGQVWVVCAGRQDAYEGRDFWHHWHKDGTPPPRRPPRKKRKHELLLGGL